VGSIIKINRIDYDIIGLLPQKGSTAYKDRDDVVIVPLNTTMARILGRNTMNVMTVAAKHPDNLDQVQLELTRYLRELRKISDGNPENFEVHNMNDIKELYTQTTDIISSMLQAIAAVSLLVGGIGIMNVMFVSVKERTREVGLRKAIGAKRADILIQFLIESILIGLLGGLFGTIVGFILCQFAESYLGWQAVISWHAIVVAFSFSAAVGILFGLWPAKQASELSPIEALRYE
jgi:macrolide transport system ATP-binding/permease protein